MKSVTPASELKVGYFILEGVNSFSTVYYFYYIYFLMQNRFGFDNKANLVLAAFGGLVCMVAAWLGGKFAQRFGGLVSLKVGFASMSVVLLAGLAAKSAAGQVLVMTLNMIGMCFTWPALEALVSEGEPPAELPRMVGIYNVVWSATAAIANFTGGAMLQKLGSQSLFYVPAALQLAQLGFTFWLAARHRALVAQRSTLPPLAAAATPSTELAGAVSHGEIAKTKTFRRMAWLANPFAYIALNTVIAIMPGIARKLELSTMLAGFCGSVWCFARLGAFLALYLWDGWHYRLNWLVAAYLTLIGSFGCMLLASNLAVLVVAQLFFGTALGLIYYSSLFYSMDSSDTKGEHGGIHEAAIGFGNFAGPAVGAAALQMLPQHSESGALAVTALLIIGFGGLLTIWRRGN